jgi:NADH-quinone oxidoreductase subunit E
MMPAMPPGASPAAGPLTTEEQDYLDRLIVRHRGRPGMLLNILEEIQENQPKKFLPLEYLEYLSSRTGIPGSQIYSVATFYALFNLKPQGRHTICICRGTACHTRGSKALLDRLRLMLGLGESGD